MISIQQLIRPSALVGRVWRSPPGSGDVRTLITLSKPPRDERAKATLVLRIHSALALFLLIPAASLNAEPRTSTSYTAPATVTNASGSRATTLSYTNDSSLGGFGGIATAAAPAQTLKTGYIGQLHDATALQLSAATPTLAEGGTDQLAAMQHFDDDTTFTPPASSITWSVQSGPLASISPGGLATAAAVYQNTAATAHGSYGGLSGTLALTVLETIADNFGTFGGDSLPDTWQAQYFAPGALNAGPGDNFDGDGLSNLLEFAFGTDPTQSSSGSLAYAAGLVSQRGQPAVSVQNIPNSVDFRAAFIRRKDYLAAGLVYQVQFSGDLSTWHTSAATPTLVASDAETDAVTVPYPFFVNGKKARFFRVSVDVAP